MGSGDDCPFNDFEERMKVQMWLVNALLMVNVILVAIMVVIGTYGHRYRSHRFTRILHDGAASLFLPIMSYVFSQDGGYFLTGVAGKKENISAACDAGAHMFLVILWTGLVYIIAINTTATVVGDYREGRNTGPPIVLLVQALWTSYLAVQHTWTDYNLIWYGTADGYATTEIPFSYALGSLLFLPIGVIISRMILKFYAFYKVRGSFALGRNPRLVVGYMRHLRESCHHNEDNAPPPLLVMGEETAHVEEEAHGYNILMTSDMNHNMLVTITKIWELDDNFLGQGSPFKDVCLSFALFKLLRCRFARYTIDKAGLHKVYNFFWHVLLKDDDAERVFGVIKDELSFLYEYYYSSLPLSYPNHWFPILCIFISLLSVSHCLFAATRLMTTIKIYSWKRSSVLWGGAEFRSGFQVRCHSECERDRRDFDFGTLNFDLVPVYLLLPLVVLTEARDIASFICSNWTKVVLICRYVNNSSWQQNPFLKKCVGHVLRCRYKLLKHWQDKMNQCSILVLRPRKTPLGLLWRLVRIPLPDKKKRVKVPTEVKSAIVDTLRSYEGSRSNGVISLRRRIQIGNNLNWMFNGKGTADTMLVCHVATSILEVRSHQHISKHKIAATHLSKYCAYLVGYSAELLPDNNAWCKNLYKDVKKDAERVLAGATWVSMPQTEHHQRLADLLIKESEHYVLKNGAELGKRLADVSEGEETAWSVLAGFWSEMILYVAPSDNISEHADAMARGGELITLLWVLLAHLGIDRRSPDDTAAATDC